MATTTADVRLSVLHDMQADLGAAFTEWNGTYVADHFGSPEEEYWAVRRSAGVIDMSALQKFDVIGPDAMSFLNRVLTRDVSRAVDGQAVYSPICDGNGGFIDDGIAFRIDRGQFLLVTGGGERDEVWLREHAKRFDVAVENVTDTRVDIGVQGPRSRDLLQRITDCDLGSLGYYRFTWARVCGYDALVSRTGYSGELGYEIFAATEHAVEIWKAILQAAEPGELRPYGFKATDMLRVESALPFCGYEMDGATTPYEAGLGWAVDLNKGEFVGRPALARTQEQGPREVLVGLEMEDLHFPEGGARIFLDRRKVGTVTSPSFSPLMEKSLALARVRPECSDLGTEVLVEIGASRWNARGGRARPARVVRIPFYDPCKRRVRA
jgi:aminomethyltransferase